MFSWSDTTQHEDLWCVDCTSRQDHLLVCSDDVDLSFTLEFDTVRLVGDGIDEDLQDVRMHSDVKVLALANRTQESLGRRTSRTTSNCSLRNHEASLICAVAIPVLISCVHDRNKNVEQKNEKQRNIVMSFSSFSSSSSPLFNTDQKNTK